MARSPGGPGGPGSEMSWKEIWERLTGKTSGQGVKPPRKLPILWIIIGMVVVIWLLTGIYTVGPGEEGVVRRFGDHVKTAGPGLHYHIPGPVESVRLVNIEEIRTAEIGFRTLGNDSSQSVEKESHMLTQDENIVEVEVIVQYKVKDSAAFLFNVFQPEQMLHDATEVSLRSVVGDHTIDFVMIEGRSTVQTEVQTFLQKLLDDYDAGLQITNLKLQYAGPPDEVEEAFNQVQAAREDKQTLIREAEGYAADRVPKARGEAEKTILEARAYEEQRVLKAEGDASKFLAVLKSHEIPAAFEVLAKEGITEAIDVLAQVGEIEEITSGTFMQTAIEDVLNEVIGEGTSTISLPATDQLTVLTRARLYDILSGLGVTGGISQADELTGQKLIASFGQLGLDDEFQQAYERAIGLTEKRLYLETMEEVLTNTEKFIVDSSIGGNLMPFLPLKELTGISEPLGISTLTQEAGGAGQ